VQAVNAESGEFADALIVPACNAHLLGGTIPHLMPTKKLTKSAFLQRIAEETETDRRTAGFFLDTIIGIVLQEVKKGGECTLPGLGKLVKQKRKARIGRNPKTGEKLKIAAKTVVKFRLAKAAKEGVLGVR
jgi:DNA-binding protein HU-beta